MKQGQRLTEQQAKVMSLVAQGKSVGQVARVLKIKPHVAYLRMDRIRIRLGVKTIDEAVSAWKSNPDLSPPISAPWGPEDLAELHKYIRAGIGWRECTRLFHGRRGETSVKNRHYRESKRLAAEAESVIDDGAMCDEFIHIARPVGQWRIDHPVVGRSVFELEAA